MGYRILFALPLALLIAAPAEAAPKKARAGWDGRWVGAWGGSRPTAQIVKGGQIVAYEYEGREHPVSGGRVTPKRIVYNEGEVAVTITRTGPNTAQATIKTPQGDGTAELTRE